MASSETLRHCGTAATIDIIGEDLLHNIFSRLPATSFASAACVSRSWNVVCERVLSRPKLASACSSNDSLEVAVKDVVDKVLSEPIRPHFAIASIGNSFIQDYDVEESLEEAHYLITQSLGSNIPVITNSTLGIIGRDAFSDEFKETQWRRGEEDNAIILTVGFLPGIKVTTIPLLMKNPITFMMKKFVTDIREFSTSVSGCSSPAAIMMFADQYRVGLIDVAEKMGYAMSQKTVIVGDYSSPFRYSNCPDAWSVGAALVFAVDRNKPSGIGETQFHAVLSSGLSPVGPTYEAASVLEKSNSIWISARREGWGQNIDAEAIRNQVYDQLGDRNKNRKLYIGVTKKGKCGQEKVGRMTSLAFYEVRRNNRKYFFVSEKGVNLGDTFRFYRLDSTAARSSVTAISSHLRSFNRRSNNTTGGDKQEVFGGLIFSCCGARFFGEPNIDSSPFLDNFPGVTLGGAFCKRVIGRGVLTPYAKESQEQKAMQCRVQARGAVYFIMSYRQRKWN
ncbi:putative F-box domain-containing protein [Helianthus annuus]|nr:putative F-box domain-containing protein [Helianthus annuus]